MSNKEVVIETVRQLPEEATFEEILEQIAIVAAIQRGEQAADAGQVLSHEEIKKRVASWIGAGLPMRGIGFPVWTPLNAVDAAAILLQVLETDVSKR